MPDLLDRLKTALADRYAIEREIGAGGMATVYLAEDLKLHRKVALKVLRPELTAALGPERFLREIEIAAKLHHPHILPLHDSGEVDGFLYYVMPYIEGESLRDRLNREKQLPLDDALQFAREVADALSYAHSHDVIHRDIKPENILLEAGHAVIADFGIARAVTAAGGEALTETGIAIGTPQYMSPEQAAGSKELDGRSDVYSLGCVLYEMLGGQPPFTGPTVESIVHQHITVEAPPITNLRPAVPAEIAGTIARALAKAPADRFSPAGQLATALDRRVVTQTASTTATVSGATGSKRWYTVGAVALAVILGALGIISRVASPPDLASADESKRILVLPFELVGSPDDSFFAEGLTGEIRRLLGRVALLRVLGRETANQAKAAGMTTQEIGDQLDVEYVLDGTVQVQRGADGSGRIRVIPELTSTADLSQVWSSAYDGSVDDVFAMQADIAQRVVDAVGIALGEPERQQLAERPTESPEAYEQFVNGEAFFSRAFPVLIGLRDAVEHYARAVAIDPGFALAYAKLALAHGGLYWGGHDPSDARLAQMKAAADEALRLNPALAEAWVAVATYHYWCCRNYEQALDELSTALEQEPHNALAGLVKAAVQRRMGNFEDAAVNFAKTADLDPLAWSPALEAGTTYQLLRKYEDALHYLSRYATLRARSWSPYARLALLHLARDGDVQRAREVVENSDEVDPSLTIFAAASRYGQTALWAPAVARVLCDNCREAVAYTSLALDGLGLPDPAMHGYLAHALLYGRLGDPQNEQVYYDSAATVLRNLVRERPDAVGLYFRLGLAYAALGRKNEAIDTGKQAVELCPLSVDAWSCQSPIAFLAEIYVRVGEYDAAIEQLDLLLSLPSELSVALLRVDPLWDPLRDNPRFQALLAKYEN